MYKSCASGNLKALLRILAAGANLRGSIGQDRPAAVRTTYHGLSQHSSNQRAASPAAARAGAYTGAFAHLLEGLGAGLDSLHYGSLADLVAEAGRL